MTAPMPKAVRPTAASIVASPVMTVPEKLPPGLNATQLAISPRQQKIATAIRYWRRNQRAHLSKRLNGDCGARQEKSSAGAKQNQQRIVQLCRSARDRQ